MSLRDLRPLLVLAVAGVGLALGHSLGHVDADLLALLPALVLFLPLLAGRYVGETRLRRLASRRVAPPARPVSEALPRRRRPRRAIEGGGLLLAARLAGRAPPLAA